MKMILKKVAFVPRFTTLQECITLHIRIQECLYVDAKFSGHFVIAPLISRKTQCL